MGRLDDITLDELYDLKDQINETRSRGRSTGKNHSDFVIHLDYCLVRTITD